MNTDRQKLNKVQVFLSSSSHMITDLYASFIIGLIPVLAKNFGLSLFMVSLLTSVNQISNSLTQPIFGYLADKHGLKYFMVSGPLFASIFASMLGIAPTYSMVLILLFLGNLSIAAFHPPSAAIARHYGGSKRALGNSIISFGGNLGYALGSLFVIFVVEKLGLRFTPITMIPGIIMSLILVKFIPSSRFKENKNKDIKLFYKIRSVNKTKIILLFLIWFTSFSRDLTWLILLTFMPLYFTKVSINLTNVGYILLLFGLLGGIGGLLAGYYSDKIKKPSYLIQLGLIISIPIFYFIFKTTGITSVILFITGGFFLVSTLPLCINLAQEILPGNISLASSLVMGLSSGSAAIAIIFFGKIADYIGIARTINYILILPLVAFFLLLIFPFFERKINKKN